MFFFVMRRLGVLFVMRRFSVFVDKMRRFGVFVDNEAFWRFSCDEAFGYFW